MRNAQQSETYAVGVDFGTESGRAVVVRGCNGERPPDPVRKGLGGKARRHGTGAMTTITPTKIEKPRRPGADRGRAPRKPCGHGRVQSASAGVAPRGPREGPAG